MTRWLAATPLALASLLCFARSLRADEGGTLAVAQSDVDASKTDAAKPDAAKPDAAKSDAAKSDAAKTDAAPSTDETIAAAPTAKEKDAPPAWQTAKAERRGGFGIGLNLGLGIGAANGFPNDSKKIGLEKYYTESGLGFASASSLWLGGALADWLTFGIGAGFSQILDGKTTSRAPILVFHTDVYPLYSLGGFFEDTGVMLQAGFGFPTTIEDETQDTLIDGAGSSYLFGGVFWDGIKAWQLHMGPFIGAHYMWSESVRRPLALAGFRVTLFTAP